MKIAVIGAHGVVGRATVPVLLARGCSVRAVDLRPREVTDGVRGDVEFVAGDILNGDDMVRAVAGCDVVLHIATAVPKPGPAMDWSKNDAIRSQGTANLLGACAKDKIKHYVQQSVSMLYDSGGDGWLDEDSAIQPNKVLKSAADMEILVRESEIPWTILRGGLLYGSSTGRESGWLRQAREGSLRLPSDGADYASLIHQDDLAAAFGTACTTPPSNRTLNIVDDEPVTWRKLLGFVAERAGAPQPPDGGPVVFPSQRVSNQRAKATLEWKPKLPSYREGLELIGQ